MSSTATCVIDSNLFVDCKQGISGGWRAGNSVWRMLNAGRKPDNFYTNELYLERYPEIATMLEAPGINHVWRNVFLRCGVLATSIANLDTFQNAVFADADPGFVDAEADDFRLRPDAVLFETVAFKPIPFTEIGLYESPWRATWPVSHEPVEVPDWRGKN